MQSPTENKTTESKKIYYEPCEVGSGAIDNVVVLLLHFQEGAILAAGFPELKQTTAIKFNAKEENG